MILSNLEEKSEWKNHKTELQSRVIGGTNASETKLKKRSFKDVLVNGKVNDEEMRDGDMSKSSLNTINSDCK